MISTIGCSAILARLRERSGPPAGAEQRVRAALDAALGSGPDGGEDGSATGGGGGSTIIGTKFGIASKVIVATVLAGGVGLLVNITTGPDRSSREVATRPLTPTTSVEMPPAAPQPHPEPDQPIVVTPLAKPDVVQRPSEPDDDPLGAEVSLLEQARATDDLAARLELLERHRARFENGLLAAERESLRISSLCELDRLDDARRAAEKFSIAHPNSPLRLRMRSACPELEILSDQE